jgi:hypothetical protein
VRLDDGMTSRSAFSRRLINPGVHWQPAATARCSATTIELRASSRDYLARLPDDDSPALSRLRVSGGPIGMVDSPMSDAWRAPYERAQPLGRRQHRQSATPPWGQHANSSRAAWELLRCGKSGNRPHRSVWGAVLDQPALVSYSAEVGDKP